MNRRLQLLLAAAVGLPGCGLSEDPAAASLDTAPDAAPCIPPADGLLPPGAWRSDESGAFTIAADGSILYYTCWETAWVAAADVADGGVDWSLSWGELRSHDTAARPTPGRATGTFCADTASLTWAPVDAGPTTYRRVPPEDMPEWCD